MQLRKNREPEGRQRTRPVRPTGRPANPAFSYYANRAPEVNIRRSPERQNQNAPTTKQRHTRLPHISLGQLPFWLLLAVVLVCVVKLLALSTTPKVVLVNQSAVTAAYERPSKAYAAAASKVLRSSLANYSKLTVDADGVSRQLEHEFPELQTVSVTLPLIGNRPIVYIMIAQPSLVLQTSAGSFALNRDGLVLAQLSSVPDNVPQVTDQSGDKPVVGKQFLPGSTVDFIQTVTYQLTAAKMGATHFILPQDSAYELDVQLAGKPYLVRFNLQEDAKQQSGAAIATIEQLGGSSPSAYLDVRTPGRIYYK